MRAGYIEHDGATAWQECDTCGLRLGEGIATPYDERYYASDNSDACPTDDCDGRMGLPAVEVSR